MTINENLPILVLEHEGSDRMSFRANGPLWVRIGGVVGVVLALAGVAAVRQGQPALVSATVFFFAIAFLYSAIFSAGLRRALVIDAAEGCVRYHEKTLFRSRTRHWTFADFACVRVSRQRAQGGEFDGVSGSNRAVWMETSAGERLLIGLGELGAPDAAQAEALAAKVASLTGMPCRVERE